MCTRPMRFWRSDVVNPKTGKYYGFISGYDKEIATPEDFKKRGIDISRDSYWTKDFVEVPCGHCPECKQSIKSRWVGRCLAESETNATTLFLTLTYDDLHYPKKFGKDDLRNFIKYLRKDYQCRYFGVGELGTETNRPHYHLILFFKEVPQKLLDSFRTLKRSDKFPVYTSSILDKYWLKKGYVSVGFATGAAIAYSIGYLVSIEKKTCFHMQSQGLGDEYFRDLAEHYEVPTGNGSSVSVTLPRYLREKYGIASEYDKDLQESLWNNQLNSSGLKAEELRDLKEYLELSKSNYR